MSTDVRVPTTGNAGEDAVIVEWNVQVGSSVAVGDILVVLETAKATIDVESPSAGEVLEIRFAAGDEVPVHVVLAVLGAPGEAAATAPAVSVLEQSAASPAIQTSLAAATLFDLSVRTLASPRARILAKRKNVDLSTISGTGPGGRVIVPDVIAAGNVATPVVSPAVPGPTLPMIETPLAAENEFELVPVRGARKVSAQRMHASLADAAQVTLTRYAAATVMLDYVARLREAAAGKGPDALKIGVNDLLLFATSRAVAKHPRANSTFDWEAIRQYRDVNLGFAVDTGQALLVPVIPMANTLTVAAIATAARASIEKARAGKLTMPEMDGGTFTVSNLGGLGVHWFTPVLNPPQTCILGVGATHQVHPAGPSLLPLSLTFDHRALDGAAAAALLADIVRAIETVDLLSAF